MNSEVPQPRKVIRTIPLRILRPRYCNSIEKSLTYFKEKRGVDEVWLFWKNFREKNSEFFNSVIADMGNKDISFDEIKKDNLYILGLDLKLLSRYLIFLQQELMAEYNKIMLSIIAKRTALNAFNKDVTKIELDEFIDENSRSKYGSYICNGLKSVVQSNLGGNFVKRVDGVKIIKLEAIHKGLMALPSATSKSFPITIEHTGSDFVKFLKSNESQLSEIEDYETGINYGDLIADIELPWFDFENEMFKLISFEEAKRKYGVQDKLLHVNLILTTYSIRRKKQWKIDGSSQSMVRMIANGELESKWKSFLDYFEKEHGEEGLKRVLSTYGIKKKSKATSTDGAELSLEERKKRLLDSFKAKSFPSKIDLIPEEERWKLHLSIDIPPTFKKLDDTLSGGIDFGVKNILTLCIKKSGEKEDYDFLTIWGNDLLRHAQTWFARNRIMRKQDEYKATSHGVSRKTRAQEKYSFRMQRLKQKITERLVKQASDFFLGRNKFHKAVGKLWYENLDTLWKGETKQAIRLKAFINKQQLLSGIGRKLKEYNSQIDVSDRYPHYTSRLCSKCGKLNLYFDFTKFRAKKIRKIKHQNGEVIELWPFFICEFCGWKVGADKNAAANIADAEYQNKLNEEKKCCGIKKKDSRDESEDKSEEKSIRVNSTSIIYRMIKENKFNEEEMYQQWKTSLKRKIAPKEQKEYKELFDYLLSYYTEIIKSESGTK